MGCDIHFYVEHLDEDGDWRLAHKPEVKYAGKEYQYEANYYGYDGRNYDLFAVLADVRNGVGFAGVVTGQKLPIIDDPRGLPDDVTQVVAEESEEWGIDGHSHSWFTLRELKEFDWGSRRKVCGVLPAREKDANSLARLTYEEWDGKSAPSSYSGGISGPNVTQVEETVYKQLRDKGLLIKDMNYYVRVWWEESIKESCSYFLETVIPRLEELAGDDLDSVRIVFWFDN